MLNDLIFAVIKRHFENTLSVKAKNTSTRRVAQQDILLVFALDTTEHSHQGINDVCESAKK